MISALDFDLRPGLGFGPFVLGSSLWAVLDPEASILTPVILHLRPHVDLLFSGTHQRLHTICLRRLRDPHPPLTVRYDGAIISGPLPPGQDGEIIVTRTAGGREHREVRQSRDGEEVLRRIGVSRTFGPTYPGDDLRTPACGSDLTRTRTHIRVRTLWGGKVAHGAVEDRMHEVKKIVVCQKGAGGVAGEPDALDEVLECEAMNGELARAVVKVHNGVALYFHPASSDPVSVQLGSTTAQDLHVDLGPPLRVHYKEDDRMKIHATGLAEEHAEQDYFYNYFQYGVDFLLSGASHVVKKIVLHTNIVGTPLFQRYKRCPWEIESAPEDDEDDTPPRKAFYERFEIISHFLSPREQPPSMVLDRTVDEEKVTLPIQQLACSAMTGLFSRLPRVDK